MPFDQQRRRVGTREPMTLLVDVGNSAVKWARLRDDGSLVDAQWLLHRHVPDVASQLAERWRDVPSSSAVIACNVASGEVVVAVERAADIARLGAVQWMRTQPLFSGQVSLANGYRNPMQLGADRWHCMLGACSTASAAAALPSGLLVVNAGTATTVDCIEVDDSSRSQARLAGRFIGGVIAPGVRLMLESLVRETAGLPAASGAATAFPNDTDAAIVTGVLDAQAGLVQQIRDRLADRLSNAPRVMLTGGNAAAISARLSIESAAIADNLVLRGLALRAFAAIT